MKVLTDLFHSVTFKIASTTVEFCFEYSDTAFVDDDWQTTNAVISANVFDYYLSQPSLIMVVKFNCVCLR